MELCEHVRGYECALNYFPNCFEKKLQLKDNVDKKIENEFKKKISDRNIHNYYEELLIGYDYIKYLNEELSSYDKIKHSNVKIIYFLYCNIVSMIGKNSNLNNLHEYNYLFIISVLKVSLLGQLERIDEYIDKPLITDTKVLNSFVSKWINEFSICYKNFDYNLVYGKFNQFYMELINFGKSSLLFMGYYDKFEEALIHLRINPNILKLKK